MSVFAAYARYYDLLYRDKDYSAEVDYVRRLIDIHAPGGRSILELGCGTGLHACMLVERGHTVLGIDMSADMLEAAQRRKSGLPVELRPAVEFESGDIRTYRHARSFDVVVSLFHVFSYQTENGDLSAAFRTAAAHLRPGGTLICDFWYGPVVLTQRPETRVKRLQDDDVEVIRIAEPQVHHATNVVDVNYEIRIVERKTQDAQTIIEQHRLRYLFLPELEVHAAQNALHLVRAYRWMTEQPPDESSWSVVAVFKKH